jgi:hypothetical protein
MNQRWDRLNCDENMTKAPTTYISPPRNLSEKMATDPLILCPVTPYRRRVTEYQKDAIWTGRSKRKKGDAWLSAISDRRRRVLLRTSSSDNFDEGWYRKWTGSLDGRKEYGELDGNDGSGTDQIDIWIIVWENALETSSSAYRFIRDLHGHRTRCENLIW